MSTAGSEYRLDGIYQQRQNGYYMQRVKLPAGVVSSAQARVVAALALRFGQGTVHLTSRGSMEIHWLNEDALTPVKRELATVGLTSRGACGGAVRGITCGSQTAYGFPAIETLARRIHRHFTGNPRFERLPKKFKIGIEADVVGGRHLIQDVGLVLARREGANCWYDVWIAGGLGKEPRPGFLLAEQLPEERIIPVIEAVVTVYARLAPPPKRLKYLAETLGEVELRQLIEAERVFNEEVPPVGGLPEHLVTEAGGRTRLELPVFAGKLTAVQLEQLAAAAEQWAEGVLMVTANQDIALLLAAGVDPGHVRRSLAEGTGLHAGEVPPILRVCPGSHECRMGLTATRDLAAAIQNHMGAAGRKLSWALSGCLNSCTQPQLADAGIVTVRLTAGEDGQKTPRYDLYRRKQSGLGEKVVGGLTEKELLEAVQRIEG